MDKIAKLQHESILSSIVSFDVDKACHIGASQLCCANELLRMQHILTASTIDFMGTDHQLTVSAENNMHLMSTFLSRMELHGCLKQMLTLVPHDCHHAACMCSML